MPNPLAVTGIYSSKRHRKIKGAYYVLYRKICFYKLSCPWDDWSCTFWGPLYTTYLTTVLLTKSENLSMYNLLDDSNLDKIANNTAIHIWGGFVIFDSATAGILGIFIIVHFIEILIGTAIHGYIQHTVCECNLHLIKATWSSLIHLLV